MIGRNLGETEKSQLKNRVLPSEAMSRLAHLPFTPTSHPFLHALYSSALHWALVGAVCLQRATVSFAQPPGSWARWAGRSSSAPQQDTDNRQRQLINNS